MYVMYCTYCKRGVYQFSADTVYCIYCCHKPPCLEFTYTFFIFFTSFLIKLERCKQYGWSLGEAMHKHVHYHQIWEENNEFRRRAGKWRTAQSAFTTLIESYEYIEIWLVLESNKGEVNDHSVLMAAIRKQALPGCCGVWVMVVKSTYSI